jgi:hypothetical protein
LGGDRFQKTVERIAVLIRTEETNQMILSVRIQICAIGLMIMMGFAPARAASITVVIDENGNAAFSDGTPLTGYSPTAGTIVLCDGATNNPTAAFGTGCGRGIVDSDILVFGGSSTNISYQSDKSGQGETNTADLSSFTLQVPSNAIFLQEAAPNANGIERTSWNPNIGQPGFFAVSGTPVQYQILSDETPEPSTIWTSAPPILGLLLMAYRRQRAKVQGPVDS